VKQILATAALNFLWLEIAHGTVQLPENAGFDFWVEERPFRPRKMF